MNDQTTTTTAISAPMYYASSTPDLCRVRPGLRHSAQLDKLAAALCRAQGQILHAVKDSANPFFKSKYADLGSVWDAIRVAFQNEGLSVAQIPTAMDNGAPALETMLMHSSGQWLGGCIPLNPVKNDPQGIGSAISYMRRYSLQSFAGVCSEDDDGEGAHGRAKAPAKPKVATDGTVKTRMPTWTDPQRIEAGAFIRDITALLTKEYGNADPADEEIQVWRRAHKYDEPADAIDALSAWKNELEGNT